MHVRSYWVHSPLGYRPDRPVALVLAFHGAGGTSLAMQSLTGLSSRADRDGFIVVYPQGLPQPARSNHYYWYASGPSDPDAHGIDDGAYVRHLLDAVQSEFCVDPARIGAIGFSNGAGLIGYLACVLSGRIAAFVAVEGEFFMIPTGCHPARPASILDVHAADDGVAPYSGVPARASPEYYAPAVPTWLDQWSLRVGCRRSSALGVVGDVGAREWWGCDGGAVIAGYVRARGGHTWPAQLRGGPGTDALLSFLFAHPLRSGNARWTPHPATVVAPVSAPRLSVGAVRTFRLPGAHAEPVDIAVASDGTVWFTEFGADAIGRIDGAGRIREYRVPTPDAQPYQLVAASDGSVWFTEYNTNRVGRVSRAGRITDFVLAPRSAGGFGIARSGRNIWIADPAGAVDRISPHGRVGRVLLAPGTGTPLALAAGSDGTAWVSTFTGYFEHARALAHLGPSGSIERVARWDAASDIDALAIGPADTLWLADYGAGALDELVSGRTLRRFADPARYGGLNDVALGPDRAMWFTDQAGVIGRVSATGRIRELALAVPGAAPDGIAAGPGNTIWVAETGAGAVLRLTLRPSNPRAA